MANKRKKFKIPVCMQMEPDTYYLLVKYADMADKAVSAYARYLVEFCLQDMETKGIDIDE